MVEASVRGDKSLTHKKYFRSASDVSKSLAAKIDTVEASVHGNKKLAHEEDCALESQVSAASSKPASSWHGAAWSRGLPDQALAHFLEPEIVNHTDAQQTADSDEQYDLPSLALSSPIFRPLQDPVMARTLDSENSSYARFRSPAQREFPKSFKEL